MANRRFPYGMFARRTPLGETTSVKEETREVLPEVAIPEVDPRRTFGQTLVHALHSVPVLGSLATLALAGSVTGYLYFSRGHNPPPMEPPRVEEPAPNHGVIPPVVDLSTPTPTATVEPTPTSTFTPTATATPVPELKPFELVCPVCTPEQLETFSKNANEDYLSVLKVYGTDEKDARMIVHVDDTGYSPNFFFESKAGGARGMGNDDFVRDRREVRHEMAHAINNTLFPTYHSWFDEGLAIYASGEVIRAIEDGSFGRDDKRLRSNPEDYWNYYKGAVPGHILGTLYFGYLTREYGLTPENNKKALSLLRKRYTEGGKELSKAYIQSAYETALGVSLNPLFDLLRPGVMILYPDLPGLERIRKEF